MNKKLFSCFLILVFCINLFSHKTIFGAEKNAIIREVSEINVPRSGMAVTEHNGKIYVIGGCNVYNKAQIDWWKQGFTNSLEVYDIETDTWVEKTPMKYKRMSCSALTINDKIYVMGGFSTTGTGKALYHFEVYDIKTDTWEEKASMPFRTQFNNNAIAVGNDIYIFGTIKYMDGGTRDCYKYNTLTEEWSKLDNFPMNLTSSVNAVNPILYNGNILMFIEDKVYQYNLADGTYEKIGETGRSVNRAFWLDDKIYVVDDRDSNAIASIYEYSISNSSVKYIASINASSCSIIAYEDRAYFIGGWNNNTDRILQKTVHTFRLSNVLSILLNIGEETQLSVQNDLRKNSNYIWSSSNSDIVTVDENGIVTAQEVGTVQISAENPDENYKEQINIKVVKQDAIRLSLDLKTGQIQRLHFSDSDKIIWKSFSPSDVSVTKDGKTKAISADKLVIISAEFDGEQDLIYVRTR